MYSAYLKAQEKYQFEGFWQKLLLCFYLFIHPNAIRKCIYVYSFF